MALKIKSPININPILLILSREPDSPKSTRSPISFGKIRVVELDTTNNINPRIKTPFWGPINLNNLISRLKPVRVIFFFGVSLSFEICP